MYCRGKRFCWVLERSRVWKRVLGPKGYAKGVGAPPRWWEEGRDVKGEGEDEDEEATVAIVGQRDKGTEVKRQGT